MERASLVAERCTTCGSLLPCVLHDRLTRRAVLSREKEKPPGYEMTWETKEIDAEFMLWISDTLCVTKTHDDHALCLLEKNPDSQTWQIKRVDMSGFSDYEWTYGQQNEMTAGTLLPDGQVLLVYKNGMFVQFDPNKHADGSYKMTKVKSGLAWMQECNEIHNVFNLADGSFLVLKDSPRKLLRFVIDGNVWTEHSIVVRHVEDGIRMTKMSNHFVPLHGGLFLGWGFFPQREVASMFVLTPPKGDFSLEWSAILINFFDPTLSAIFQKDDNLYFISPRSNQLECAKFCFNVLEQTPVPEITKIGSTQSGEKCYLAHALSANSFLACVAGGDVELWTRQKNDEWENEVIISGLKQRVTKIISRPGDQSGFFLYFEGKKKTDDDRLCYYQIPPAKLRAYHERQAQQAEVPPLPLDD